MSKKSKSKTGIQIINMDAEAGYRATSSIDTAMISAVSLLMSREVFPTRSALVSYFAVDELPGKGWRGMYEDRSHGATRFGKVSVLRGLEGESHMHVTSHEFAHAVVSQSNLRSCSGWTIAWDLLHSTKEDRDMLLAHGRRWEIHDPNYFVYHGEQQRLEEYLCDQVAYWILQRALSGRAARTAPDPDIRVLELLTGV